MNKTELSRRDWLKKGAMASFGVALAGYSNWSIAGVKDTMGKHELLPSEEHYLDYLKESSNVVARLSSNENPFGPSKKAKQAIIDAIDDSFLYPQKYRKELTDTIAELEGVSTDHILLGAGSSELLDAGAKVFGGNGGKIVAADPTYTSLVRSAERYGGEWIKIPLNRSQDHDLDTMEFKVGKDVSLVYLCNPNNPTGKTLSASEIKSFCDAVSSKVPVFVDEAYLDYVADPKASSVVECVRQGKNVIVARTFSKVHAFAGLRVGYCVGLPEVIKKLAADGPRNTLSGPSMSAARASLLDYDFIKYSVDRTAESKNMVYGLLDKKGIEYFPSETNFILFPIAMDGNDFRAKMMDKGVSLKTWKIAHQDYCRVSMGVPEDMDKFGKALYQVI